MQLTQEKKEKTHQYLLGGLLASVTASICCLGPFALLASGVSGAWMSRVMVVEPFQPFLIGATVVLFALAGKKIFFPNISSEEDNKCPTPRARRKQILAYCISGVLASILLTSEYWIVLVAQ